MLYYFFICFSGRPVSYALFSKNSPYELYNMVIEENLPVENFGGEYLSTVGEIETMKYIVPENDFGKTKYYGIVAIDQLGFKSDMSNVVSLFVEPPVTDFENSAHVNGNPNLEFKSATNSKQFLLILIICIVVFITLCIFFVIVIVFRNRRKKSTSQSDLSDTMRSMGVSTGHNAENDLIQSPGYAVCDENDLVKEQENNRFLTSSYNNNGSSSYNGSGGTQPNSVSFADENVYSSTYGWNGLHNPYVFQGSTIPGEQNTYQNSYVANIYNQGPMYAKPVPKSQRNQFIPGTPNATFPSMQHSTPQSPSGSSSHSSSNRGGNTISMFPGGGSNSLSGDERVSSTSPPIEGNSNEQVRLISTSNTPTKSILKKPKSQQQPLLLHGSQSQFDDQSSQSSNGGIKNEAERGSESSNVSFSDRDTPTAEGGQNASEKPEYSPSNTYLETSFDCQQQNSKNPPPTLPKPKVTGIVNEGGDLSGTLDKRIRNITQV